MARIVDDWIEGYLKYTNNTEPPDSFREWVAVSVVASCLRRKCVMHLGSLTIYPNMYIILVAPSGKARKGTAMRPGLKMLQEQGIKLAAEAITREALIRELNESTFTEQKAEGGLNMHCSLTVYSQELTVFLGYNNQQLLMDLTDWYDCADKWKYRTKNKELTDDIIGVWVNLIGATTPDLLQSTLPRDALGGGLLSRMIFVYEANKGKIVPAPFISPEEMELRKSLVQDLDRIGMLTGSFNYTQDFMDSYIEWYTAQENNPPFRDERFSGYFERRPTHVLKLCIILSASRDDSMTIDASVLNRAIKLLERTEVKMPAAFAGFGEADDSAVMSRIMMTIATGKSMSNTEIMKRHYYDIDRMQLSRILATLTAIGFCKMEHTGKETIVTYNENYKS